MQQQQQSASYDLMAVFPDETKADAAATGLQKAGFDPEEVHQMAAGSLGNGQFRVHGPGTAARREVFLQKQRSGPNPVLVILLALIGALLVGGITFVSTFSLPQLHITLFLIGIVVGLLLGTVIGLFQRGRVRGDIGQKAQPTTPPKQLQGARTVVALRFTDPENISRKSRARAILLNNQGKIDRSVGRLE